MAFKISAESLKEYFFKLNKEYKIIAPINTNKGIIYQEFTSEKEISLDFDTPPLPPFNHEFLDTKTSPWKKLMLFGVKPCDVKSINLMDEIFSNGKGKIEFYKQKRKNTTLIAAVCKSYKNHCFCRDLGYEPTEAPGADVISLVDIDMVYLKPLTSKGKRILTRYPLEESEFPEILENTSSKKSSASKAKKINDTFSSHFWNQLGNYCDKCEICSAVCPRYRLINMMHSKLSKFSKNSSNNKGLKQKIAYNLRKIIKNPMGCVGCGRCFRSCPLNSNVIEVLQDIEKDFIK